MVAMGISWCLIGHSERRGEFGLPTPAESSALLATKLKYLLEQGLNVILAIGEPLPIRKQGIDAVLAYCVEQLTPCKDLLDPEKVVIAYEPVWSIGTGVTASPGRPAASSRRGVVGDSGPSAASAGSSSVTGALKAGSSLATRAYSKKCLPHGSPSTISAAGSAKRQRRTVSLTSTRETSVSGTRFFGSSAAAGGATALGGASLPSSSSSGSSATTTSRASNASASSGRAARCRRSKAASSRSKPT